MRNSYHSRNLPTHSFRSPRVSYLGYTAVATSTAGSALLTRTRRFSGKLPNVSSPPYADECKCQPGSPKRLYLLAGVDGDFAGYNVVNAWVRRDSYFETMDEDQKERLSHFRHFREPSGIVRLRLARSRRNMQLRSQDHAK